MPTKAAESPVTARNAVREHSARPGVLRDPSRPADADEIRLLIDPFASYTVTALSEKFNQVIYGVEFVRGKAIIEALPAEWKGPTWGYPKNYGQHESDLAPGADWAEVQDRVKALEYFVNAHEFRKDKYRMGEESGVREKVGENAYPQFKIERKD